MSAKVKRAFLAIGSKSRSCPSNMAKDCLLRIILSSSFICSMEYWEIEMNAGRTWKWPRNGRMQYARLIWSRIGLRRLSSFTLHHHLNVLPSLHRTSSSRYDRSHPCGHRTPTTQIVKIKPPKAPLWKLTGKISQTWGYPSYTVPLYRWIRVVLSSEHRESGEKSRTSRMCSDPKLPVDR